MLFEKERPRNRLYPVYLHGRTKKQHEVKTTRSTNLAFLHMYSFYGSLNIKLKAKMNLIFLVNPQ